MNYSDILQSLNQASAFDPYRMRAAIAYAFLHRILDIDAAERDIRELPSA